MHDRVVREAFPSDGISPSHRQVASATVVRVVAPSEQIAPASYFRWKHLLGQAAAGVLLVVGLPIIGILVVLVRLTSRGPGIYRQIRVGKNGRQFAMYKIRTMRQDAEAASGPVWTQTKDPRVTGIGRVLRKLHLDELPQLFNVLRGEMSLIGPRPERPEFVCVLVDKIPGYADRLAIRPGITGLAQLNLPPDTDLQSVHRKLVLDVEYVKQASLWLDIRLFLCTFGRMFKLPEGSSVWLFGVGRTVALNLPATENDSSEVATPTALLEASQKMDRPAHAAKGPHAQKSRRKRHAMRPK
jgi:lipopolysaccharide/colanic/teichoic acid biosynthesis glycosyltransferase